MAARSSQSIAQITEQTVELLARNTSNRLDDWFGACELEAGVHDVLVQPTSAGLIQIRLGDRAIAAWLNFILENLPGKTPDWPSSVLQSPVTASKFQAQAFAIQHAHARCCSILQMAQREGLVILNPFEQCSAVWQFVEPASIPWLADNFHLRLTHPSERRLICQLLAVLDQVGEVGASPRPNESFRLAEMAARCFQAFHRDRPIWQNVASNSIDRAQAQLGLVMATQRILYWLLNDLLGIYTPSSL